MGTTTIQGMCSDKVITCAKVLADKKLQIAFVESATAGRMCSEFALTEFSGDVLSGGISCYSVSVKKQVLNVPEHLIKTCTPESAEVTKALAQEGAKLFKSDVTAAITGLTCPGGSENAEKPVGTIFLHIIFNDGEIAHREVFDGAASEIIMHAIDRTSEIITNHLLNR